jgi:hypothetical protein
MAARGFKSWCENTAEGLRRELGVGAEDPLDPRLLATHLDVTVWRADEVPGLDAEFLAVLVEEDPDSWSAVTIPTPAGVLIVTNPAHSAARTASNIMHELAHIIIGHEASRVHLAEDGTMLLNGFDREQEDDANWLSGCLLLPRAAILRARKLGMSDAQIADGYGISRDMVTFRSRVTGVDVQLARKKGR